MHDLPSSYDDDAIVNPSANTHFQDVIAASLTRRRALQTTAAVALLSSTTLAACGGSSDPAPVPPPAGPVPPPPPPALNFTAVPKGRADAVVVPEGYQVSVLHAVGDAMHWGDASWKGDGSESADSYNRRIGDGHDGMHYFGLAADGTWSASESTRGLLCVNHEYVVAPHVIHPMGITGNTAVGGVTIPAGVNRVAAEVDKEIAAHGASIVEVKRSATGTGLEMVRGSRYNRRITSATEMALTGPAGGSAQMVTRLSADGTRTRGMNNNCANGYTPWGTYLTCEENILNVISRAAGDDALRSAAENTGLLRYGLPANRRSPYAWDSAGVDDAYARFSSSVTGASAAEDFRHTFNTFGWVVEIDPFAPESMPAKRTGLGRFSHEGAWPAAAVAGKPIVIYMGDDARNEYIYKFVSTALWDPADVNGGMAAGAKYLDHGTLYVARFDADGTGEWLALTHGQDGLDAANATYPFADQADVLIHARLAADVRGATKMDRPEWGGVNPKNGDVYMTLTNNSTRTAANTDAANPRYYEDSFTRSDGSIKTNKGNVNGHIIRWAETGADPAATTFKWDIYLFGAQADAAADVNLSGLTADNDFSSPDGLSFDERGLLWIQTDDGAYTDVTNCMLLAAIPGQVGDGDVVTAASGRQTLRGAQATADTLRRFLVGPVDCEITGLAFTPDHKTLLCNIQHPGEDSTPDWATGSFSSHWPANHGGADGSGQRPRSATLVITRTDGGVIGLS